MPKVIKNESGRYAKRGVSATKGDVHAAVDKLDAGLYPGAFCKVTKDYLNNDRKFCNIIHSDGSGTKAVIAYLKYKETGDPSVFHGIAQDSLVMNLDDLLCVGVYDNILFSNTLNRNPHRIPAEVIKALIEGTEGFLSQMRRLGLKIHSGGGETADVPDLTQTLTVDSCAVARVERKKVITGAKILPGLSIVGLSSTGQASYENRENSGIGSNGLTSARHDILSKYYFRKHAESCSKDIPKELCYCGPFKLEDALPKSDMSIGDALLSPTRTYAPIIADLLRNHFSKIKGIVHCSGGGQSKCLRFGNAVHFIKDQLFPTPPLFEAIQKHSKTSWKEMYRVYNMGHRMEIYCKPSHANCVIQAAAAYNIEAKVIGHTEPSTLAKGQNHLSLKHKSQVLKYKL